MTGFVNYLDVFLSWKYRLSRGTLGNYNSGSHVTEDNYQKFYCKKQFCVLRQYGVTYYLQR